MKIDDVRKTVSNPKPLYFAAGLGDAAVEVLKDAPAHLNALSTTLSAKAGVVATDVAGKVAGTAETLQSRITLTQIDPKALRDQFDPKALRDQLGQLDPKALRARLSDLSEPDLRAAREKAQTLLLQQVGWALEVAGKAVETYDEYSERGKGVVDRVLYGRGGTGVEVVDVEDATRAPAERVVVEHVTVVEAEPAPAPAEAPKTEAPKADAPKPEAKAETKAEAPKAAPKPEAKPQADKPAAQANGQKAAAKKPAAPRRPAGRAKKAE
jgi:hypothetical protein